MSNEHLDLSTSENLSDDLGATLGTSPLDTGAKLNRGSLRDNRIHDSNVLVPTLDIFTKIPHIFIEVLL